MSNHFYKVSNHFYKVRRGRLYDSLCEYVDKEMRHKKAVLAFVQKHGLQGKVSNFKGHALEFIGEPPAHWTKPDRKGFSRLKRTKAVPEEMRKDMEDIPDAASGFELLDRISKGSKDFMMVNETGYPGMHATNKKGKWVIHLSIDPRWFCESELKDGSVLEITGAQYAKVKERA